MQIKFFSTFGVGAAILLTADCFIKPVSSVPLSVQSDLDLTEDSE